MPWPAPVTIATLPVKSCRDELTGIVLDMCPDYSSVHG
jgi:hypothetical protein